MQVPAPAALSNNRLRDLILAGAILSIMLNPLFFALLDRWLAKEKARDGDPAKAPAAPATREPIPVTTLSGHVILVGHGRVGRYITDAPQSATISADEPAMPAPACIAPCAAPMIAFVMNMSRLY